MTMDIKDIFLKDVARPIEGVVKADDTNNLGIEVEEYVFTNDAAKWVSPLLEDYVNNDLNNGVWISGFFGSGKSHLLKMLAHLLGDVEGQAFPREKVSAAFAEKTDEEMFKATLSRVAQIPAKSILFNIDMKANVVAKEKEGALLGIFYKVFDEMRGYYGNDRAVARFEESLDKRGQLQAFKDAFESISGYSWNQGREAWSFETEYIDQAFQQVTGSPATDVFRSFERTDEQTSIENFAHDVNAWLDEQPAGTRLNFFVDEVGQFIGDNISLMLNLQTLVESLNTITKRRAWLFVTSQEDMEKVIGDRTKSQQNDFSKIQARFQHRVKLSSQDVEEVISKRLLKKNEAATSTLKTYYEEMSGSFRTMFEFTDGSTVYKNYDTQERFLNNYPFVTYQFQLFREAIQGLSDHNAFEGRNSSVGERSMLGVVQEVAKKLASEKVGTLVTFDQMLGGISAALKSALTRAIGQAEAHLEYPENPEVAEIAIKVLKALFLVKYVDSFKATSRNLVTLLQPAFECDRRALTANVEKALQLLEVQSYVQRTGTIYEFLTDEEQEIEKEIKNTELDSSEISSQLYKWIQKDVLDKGKITYKRNGRIFDFEYRIDGNAMSKSQALSIDFITPTTVDNYDRIIAQSRGQKTLYVVLGDDERRLLVDLNLFLKSGKYIKQRTMSQLAAQTQAILNTKKALNSERENELTERVKQAVSRATLIANGSAIEVSSHDAKQRIEDGFQELVDRSYTQFQALGPRMLTDKDLDEILAGDEGTLPLTGPDIYAMPAGMIESRITGRTDFGTVTLAQIISEFEEAPYGWDSQSIVTLVAWLLVKGKITLTLDGNQILRSDARKVLLSSAKWSQVLVAKQKSFSPKQIKDLRDFYTDFFATSASLPSDPLELARSTAEQLGVKLKALQAIAENKDFPFAEAVAAPLSVIKQSLGKNHEWYLTDFDTRDELLEDHLEDIENLSNFVSGPSGQEYLETKQWAKENHVDLMDVEPALTKEFEDKLSNPRIFAGNLAKELLLTKHDLENKINNARAALRTEVKEQIDEKCALLQKDQHFLKATSTAQQSVLSKFDAAKKRLVPQMSIAQIRYVGSRFLNEEYDRIIEELYLASVPAVAPLPSSSNTDSNTDVIIATTPHPSRKTIALRSIRISNSKVILETEADVDDYVNELRDALLDAINDGKAITR